jgi:hypothetical protein
VEKKQKKPDIEMRREGERQSDAEKEQKKSKKDEVNETQR